MTSKGGYIGGGNKVATEVATQRIQRCNHCYHLLRERNSLGRVGSYKEGGGYVATWQHEEIWA
jgi:hypothetical protein